MIGASYISSQLSHTKQIQQFKEFTTLWKISDNVIRGGGADIFQDIYKEHTTIGIIHTYTLLVARSCRGKQFCTFMTVPTEDAEFLIVSTEASELLHHMTSLDTGREG